MTEMTEMTASSERKIYEHAIAAAAAHCASRIMHHASCIITHHQIPAFGYQ